MSLSEASHHELGIAQLLQNAGFTDSWDLARSPSPEIVCRPARESRTGRSPKELLGVLSRVISEIGVLSGSAPEGARCALESTPESTPISESTFKSSLGSTFGDFPVLASLADRQTLKNLKHFATREEFIEFFRGFSLNFFDTPPKFPGNSRSLLEISDMEMFEK